MSESLKNIRAQFWVALKAALIEDDFVPATNETHTGFHVKFKKKFNAQNPKKKVSKYSKFDFHITEKGKGFQIAFCLDVWETKPNDKNSNKWRASFFSHLLKARAEIDEKFGEGLLSWSEIDSKDPQVLYKIKVPIHTCDIYSSSEWDEIFQFARGFLQRFDEALAPHLLQAEMLAKIEADSFAFDNMNLLSKTFHLTGSLIMGIIYFTHVPKCVE